MFNLLVIAVATVLGALAGWLVGGYGTMAVVALIGMVSGLEDGPPNLAYLGGLIGAVVGGILGFTRARRALHSHDG